jgi:hypothetical protein
MAGARRVINKYSGVLSLYYLYRLESDHQKTHLTFIGRTHHRSRKQPCGSATG